MNRLSPSFPFGFVPKKFRGDPLLGAKGSAVGGAAGWLQLRYSVLWLNVVKMNVYLVDALEYFLSFHTLGIS